MECGQQGQGQPMTTRLAAELPTYNGEIFGPVRRTVAKDAWMHAIGLAITHIAEQSGFCAIQTQH